MMRNLLQYFLFTFSFILFFSTFSFAKQYTASGRIHQVDGPVDDGDVNQKVLKIVLNVGNGGAGANRTSMSFNLYGNTEILNAKLYYRTVVNDSNFSAATLAQTIASPGASITFSGFTIDNSTVNGDWFYWLVIDAKATVTTGVKIDADYTGSTGAGSPGFISSLAPTGFRFTSRNYLIGNTVAEQYPTIAATAAAIARFDYDGAADIFMEMTANYANPAETGFTFSNHTGPANITIRPQAGQSNKITGGDPGSGIVFMGFSGVQKIILDGRAGGTGPVQWTIRNTRTAVTVASTMKFLDEASNNTFQYLNIEGEGGIISIETSAIATGVGNDNITFSNCFIRDLTVGGTGTFPFLGINGAGTAGKTNDNITIDNCQFVDIFNPALTASSCILVNTNCDNWTISNNHFYQTTNYANLNTNTFAVIGIYTGSTYNVTGNFIGGRAPGCGGSAYTITSGALDFNAIKFGPSITIGTCYIYANTIANIAYTPAAITLSIYPFAGIALQGNTVYNCGGLNQGNIIGATSGTGSITVANTSASGLGIVGIYVNCTGTNNIAYNKFGAITLNGTRGETDLITVTTGNGTTTIDNNILGNADANNIIINPDAILYGISNSVSNGMTCTNNTFQNIKHLGSTQAMGMIYNANGPMTCTGNTFKNISTSTNINSWMIDHQPSTADAADISNNTIQDISFTNTGTSAKFFGLSINTTGNGNTCNNNTVGSITNNNISIASNATSYGIYHSLGGTLTCNNNTVQEFNLTSTGTSATFDGIANISGAGVITASGNTIKNIDLACTTGGIVLHGIFNGSTTSGHLITKNTVQNLTLTSTANIANRNYAIHVQYGTGTVTKNFVSGIYNLSTSTTSEIAGIAQGNASDYNYYNNVVILDGSGTVGYMDALSIAGTGNATVYHNTFKLTGSATGGTTSEALFFSATGTKNIKNNIFQNLRTGGGVRHYAINLGSTASLTENNNYLEVANDQNQVCYYTSDNTFAQWKTNTNATNDLNGTITLDAIGKVSTSPFIGAGTGTNLTATVVDDKLDVTRGAAPWMGAYEGQNITVNTISPLAYCAGGAVSVPYTVGGGGSFNAGNNFTAQLSNSAGSFASPTTIGILGNTTTSGTIATVLPGGISGPAYRIRVISSDPLVTGSDNGSDINIQTAAPAAPTINPATAITCSGFTANWVVNGSPNYYLDVATDAGFTAFVAGYNNLKLGNVSGYAVTGLTAGTNYYYRARAENGCGLSGNSGTTGPVLTSGTQKTYLVDNTADTDNGLPYTAADGTNTLRKCIRLANANCGHDIINFNITGGGPFTITISSVLPNLTDIDGVTINGFSQSGAIPNSKPVFNATAGTPMNPTYKIILSNGGAIATGLIIASGSNNNIIQGLVMQNFGDGTVSANDIAITINSSNNQVLGCYIGMDITGTTQGTKTADGIVITGANNKIGDGTAAGANLISGMNGSFEGILINGAGATGNTVKGNMLGLQKDGTTIVTGATQFSGVYIFSSAISNTIGGSAAGEGNVISGNNNRGVYLNTTIAGGNTVIGNIIGTRADGINYITSNPQTYGIMISSSPDNIIGGNSVSARNIISANEIYGIDITGAGSTGNMIKGNYIGIAQNGTTFISGSTQDYGIGILSSAASNTIGGSGAGDGNLISGGSANGVYINSSAAAGNTVLGNIIGPQADGITYLASNLQNIGVYIDGSPNNTIGGNTAGARNIISANETYGVYFYAAGSTGNVVQGNYIGIDKTGTSFITGSTQDYGVYLFSNSGGGNTIGGSGAGEGNVLSGNTYGIGSLSTATAGNTVLGNIIGPQADGITYLASNPQVYGINIIGSPNNTIGGNTAGARNIISANETAGIYMTNAGTTGNIIKGNYIGIAANGTTFITNSTQNYGIDFLSTCGGNNIIGGSGVGEGNVISGNKDAASTGTGIVLSSSAIAGNSIDGNIIGPRADGINYLSSNAQSYGIWVYNSPNNTIGGNTAGARNIISANETYGVYIEQSGSAGNVIKGNYIGIDKTGTTFIANSTQDYGVYITSSAASNTIGGSGAGEGNVISGNNAGGSGWGIYLNSSAVAGNTVLGNIIGPQADGITYLTSNLQGYGIEIINSLNNTIGGNSAGARNIISANEQYGVYIVGASSTGNIVKGNYIGIAQNGTAFITGSTQDYGVYLNTTAGGTNTIGGSGAGEGNVISGNKYDATYGYGISISSSAAAGNTFLGNIIGPQADGFTYLASNPQYYGIYIFNSPNNTIGGNTAGARNIISANENYGVFIRGSGSTGNAVKGNYIGPSSSLSNITSSSQDYGVYIYNSAANNIFGSTSAGEANQIAFNTINGVYLSDPATTGNKISGNPIYSNTGKAINLNYGVNQANNGMAAPVISAACFTAVSGTSVASAVIEVFKNTNGNCNDANTFVGTTTADGAGNWSLTGLSLVAGEYALATATDGSNNTSEFSACTAIIDVPATPTANAASSIAANSFTANWAAAANATSYYLQVAADAAFTIIIQQLNVGNVTSYNVTGLTGCTTYYYRVRGVNGCGNSIYSATISATTLTNPTTFTVSNTADAGAGSLRQAITDANANCGHDVINFSIAGAGPFTISLSSALPNLTDNDGVTIDGFSQSGSAVNTVLVFNTTAGTPLNATEQIILGNGANIPTGLILASDNNIIKGLVLQDFGDGTPSNNDIAITITGNNNSVLGNYIGMDYTGTTRGTKTAIGINISGANNAIGNGTAAGANLISGMNGTLYGIQITGAAATGNTIKGNSIGLQKNGSTVVAGAAQGYGIYMTASAASNTIGGSGAGEGNVISGNSSTGIYNSSSAAAGNTVLGNIIGPQANGTSYVTSNVQSTGIYIFSSPNNTIGGNTVGARNIISANEDYGIYITGANSTGNIVKGNYIGIDKNGTTFIINSTQDFGVWLDASAASNTIGGSGSGEGNVISGNKDATSSGRGIFITSTAAAGNTVLGNIIGPQADGVTYLASNAQYRGIEMNPSPNNTIGGNTAGARNIISANESIGVFISGASSTGNVVKGNYIGIDKNGTTFIINSTQDFGIQINSSAASNTIGGSGAGEGNVISGNSTYGIYTSSSAAAGNSVLGNIIGPQANGTSYVTSNLQTYGIYISGSPNNTIGGNTAGARNIISANETSGIYIDGAGSTGNVVKGNYIGIDKNGTTFITGSTQDYGVFFSSTSGGTNTIGGSGAGEGNVISGNKDASSSGRGIYLLSSAAAGNSVLGNIIGPQADGLTYLTSNSQSYGIYISGSPNNTIGGNTAGARNIISANESIGLYILGASSTGNTVKGNYIGIDKNGTTFITGSTQDFGVVITSSAASNTIGGSGAGEGNVVSGNKDATSTGRGIYLLSSAAAGNSVLGNIIGAQADGITYLASNAQNYGVHIQDSPNNIIGGNTAGVRNIISANETYGVYIIGATSTGNIVKGNYIGPSSSLANIASSNQDYGVYLLSSAANNKIGTGLANEENQIAFNTVNGVYLTGAATNGNLISKNPIYSNTGKEINLNYGASQANSGIAVPVISTATATTVSGTSGASNVIEVFKNTTTNCNDATTYLGSATANGAGAWSLAVALVQNDYVLATARDGSSNTSEFSTCRVANTDFYWVGGAGMWNDPTHWSATSGGAGGAGIPDINTNVFIDDNSGTGATIPITIPGPAAWYTKAFTMSGSNGKRTPIVGRGSLLPRP